MTLKSLIKEISKSVRESLENTTIHAIPNILKAKHKITKVIWLFFLLISGTLCFYFVREIVKVYLSNDVTSTVKINYPLDKIEFPVIGICNLNKWADINTTEAILQCRLGSMDCSPDFFTKYFDSEFGSCIRINSGNNLEEKIIKYVYDSGYNHGLSMDIYINSRKPEISAERGLILFINNENIDSSFKSGIKLSPGFSTDIVLNIFKTSKSPFPLSYCTNDLTGTNSECFKKTLAFYKRYKYSFCENLCLQKIIGDICDIQISNFGALYYYDKKNVTYNELAALNCTIKRTILFENSYKYLIECGCPLECEDSRFTYHYSMSTYPTSSYVRKLINMSSYLNSMYPNYTDLNFNEIRNNILAFKIYYDEMKEIVYNEIQKNDIFDLIANTGGTIGLFLGLSLLSFVEIIEMVANILIIIFRHFKCS